MTRQDATMLADEFDDKPETEPETNEDIDLAKQSLKAGLRGAILDCAESRQPGAAEVNGAAMLRELADELDADGPELERLRRDVDDQEFDVGNLVAEHIASGAKKGK